MTQTPVLPEPFPCGNLRTTSVRMLAERAARAISMAPVRMAVTVNVDDEVHVECADQADPVTILVAFDGGLIDTMARRIREDLVHEAGERKIKLLQDRLLD